MNKIKCPACGSSALQKSISKRLAHLTIGGTFDVEEESYKCATCGEEGDFGHKNDDAYLVAEKNAEAKAISQYIEQLNENKISMARFERAFELPQRTMARWKSGDFSAASVALLRTVYSCPWLVDVAEHGFDKHFLSKTIIGETVKCFGEALDGSSRRDINGIYVYNSPSAFVEARIESINPQSGSLNYDVSNSIPYKVVGG